MSNNALIMSRVQGKIDLIVNEAPKLFERLGLIMCTDAILSLMYGNLWALYHLVGGNTSQIPPPVLSNVVPDEIFFQRKELLKKLEGEVICFFEKIQGVLNWRLVVDLCGVAGWYIIPQEGETERLRIIDIYCDHVEALADEKRLEERRRELEGSSSSENSCNIQFG